MYRRTRASAAAARITLASLSKVNSSFSIQTLSPPPQTFKNLSTNAQRSDFYHQTHPNSNQNPTFSSFRETPNPSFAQNHHEFVNGYSQNPTHGGAVLPPNTTQRFQQQNREFGQDTNWVSQNTPQFQHKSELGKDRNFTPNGSYSAGGSGASRDTQSAPMGYSVNPQIPWNQGGSAMNQFQQNPIPNGYQVPPIPNGTRIGFPQNPNGMHTGTGYPLPPTNANPDNAPDETPESSQYKGTLEELDAFCRENKVKEAVEVFEMLVKQGVIVDLPRYVLLMQLCANIGVLKFAKSVHEHLVRSAGQISVGVHNKVLDMYSKCGSMSDAYKVFENMTERNLTSWDTMITGLAKNGYGEDAIDLFTQFKEAGLKPDGQMFMGVFLACSVLCDVKEGMLHFESMSKVYGIVPSMDHYVSVVSMLGSVGYLDEAKEFIEKMPIEANATVWEALMNICRVHGNIELGDHCEEVVNYLDPSRSVDQSKKGLVPVKASDIEKEVEKKKLSNNLTDVQSKVYNYKAGDAALPENERIYVLLRGMMAQMKEVGYVPNMKFVLHDVDDETKEENLLSHSERLALAQGVMTSSARSTIRIIKNLRVCGDCHVAMKFASKLTGRLIIMRDAKRFHHFSDGVCSCKDYW